MEKESRGWSLGELAILLGGELAGPAELRILRATTADTNDVDGLTFAENETYLAAALQSEVGAVLVPMEAEVGDKPAIRVARPRETFGRFLAMCARPLPIEDGIHPMAVVSPEASVDPTARIGAFAVVERGAVIGPGTRVYPHAYIGENCRLGEKCVIYPQAVLYQDVTLGNRCTVHAGAILGADGFGYVWDGKQRVKVPQVGGVAISDDVEVGANTSIDRATAGLTRVGRGTKLDNLIQVAHNCQIGEDTVIASLVGISGSTKIGNRNTIAGQTATNDHVSTCDDVTLGGRTAVTGDIKAPGAYLGFPARPLGEAMRNIALSGKLQDLFNRVRDLERKVGGKG